MGCDTFSQLFARYPVLDTIGGFYVFNQTIHTWTKPNQTIPTLPTYNPYPDLEITGEFDSMEVHGINVGEALR